MLEIKKDFSLFFSFLKKMDIKKFKLIIVFITVILSNYIGLLNPYLFGKTIDSIINHSLSDIKKYIFLMFLAFLVSLIINYINNIETIKLSNTLEINMKKKIFSSVLYSSYYKFNKTNKGKLINNIESDSTVFANLLTTNMNLIMNVIDMVTSLFIMLFINPYLTLVLLLSLPITALSYTISGKKIKNKEIKLKEKNDSYITFLTESIYGWKTLKLFNIEKLRLGEFNNILNELYGFFFKKVNIQIVFGNFINIISYVAYILNLILGIYFILQGKFSLGMLTAFNTYSDKFKTSSLSLSQLNSIVQEVSVSLSRINNILNNEIEVKELNNNCFKFNNEIKNIKLKGLSYKTECNNVIFNSASINFEKGNIYVIKGESGSGKTTLLNMLCKFIDKYSGEILINEYNLKNINSVSLRDKISYITQDNFIYSLSVYDNITLYRDISYDKVVDICKKLNIHNKIMALPDKYNTILNVEGINLSGGEKQRLCIARSIITKPDVFLFDEITASIDKKNTTEILRIIEDLSKKSIVILTTHEILDFSIPTIEYILNDNSFILKS